MRKLLTSTAAIVLIAISGSAVTSPPARAQTTVYDPAAVSQMVSQVSNSLRQIQQLQAQLANQAAMLQRLGSDVTGPLAQIAQQANQVMQQAQGIGYSGQNAVRQFQQMYPTDMSGQSLQQYLQRYGAWQQNSRRTLEDSMRVQNDIVQSQAATAGAVSSAVAASQGAAGQTAAIQATNQLLAAQALQLQGLQSILIAQARTQETVLAQQQAATAAARAESQRHNTYNRVRGSFSGDRGL
jgi:P-type conjugative transfer protein TrbJ